MSESEHCPSDHPSPPPSSSGTVCYMQRNCISQENNSIQSGTFRMPPTVKPCIIPQNFGTSENSSSCTQSHVRNVNELGNQSQGRLIHVHSDVASTSLNYQGSEISVKRDNIQTVSVYPSTSFGVKRKHTQVSHRNVFENSKSCKCSHEDSYTTGYTSDDSEEDSLHSKRYKSRTHQNVGVMKTYPYSLSKSEIVPSAGRPLLRDKSLGNSQILTKQCPTYFKHLKKDPDFGCTSKYEIEPIWEERKFQLAMREQKICEAEEALKQEEEKAQECLQLALQQQELALNEREEALRLREAAVQKKYEQATRLLEESRKVVDSSKFRLGKGFIGPNADQTTKLNCPLQFGHDSLELSSTNFHVSSSIDNSNRDPNLVEDKDLLIGLGVDRSGSFSEKVSAVEKKCNLTTVALPKQEIPGTSSSSFTRNTLQSNVQGLIHVPENYENKPCIEPGKVVRTYTRANRFRNVSGKSGPSVLCKTDTAIPPRAHSVTPFTKTSVLKSKSLFRVGAPCNEETVINGGTSVTITPLTADERPPRSFSAIPKLEFSYGYEDGDNEDSTIHVGQMFTPVEGITELEPKCMFMGDNQTKDRPVSDQFKVLPPKFVNTKPVPPVDKCNSQRLLKSEPKSETSLYSYETIGIDTGAESKGDTSSNNISMKGGLYQSTSKFNGTYGKIKGNLSMRTLAVVSIPGCENENDESQGHSEVKPESHIHGCYKSAGSCKTKGVTTAFSNVNDVSVVQTRNFVCGTKDTSEIIGETLSCEQNVNMSDNFDNQESVMSVVDDRQLQCDVACHISEKNPQSLSRAHNTQQWHERPFRPGDILYTPVNKLNSQIGQIQGYSSPVDTQEFKHMSVMSPLSLQYSKEVSSSNIKLNRSLNSDETHLTDPTSRVSRDTPSHKNEVKPVLLSSTPKSLSVSSGQGTALTYVSSVPVKHIMPSPINSVQLPSSQLDETTIVRNSLQGSCMTSQQNVISITNSSILSTPSNHNLIYSNSPHQSNSVQSCSAKDFKEAQQKSLLETSGPPNFVDETQSSQKFPQVLIVSSADTQVLPVVQGAVEQTGSPNIQFGHVSLQVGNISQVRLSQPLDFQESKSPCNTQWSSSNFNTPVSEVLTNLGDYDPISQTLTTSNPMFLQSILENNVSAGLASNSLVNSVTNSTDGIGKVSSGQNTVQLQTEHVCGNGEEVTPIYNSDFTNENLEKEQGNRQASNDKDDDGRSLKEEDPTCVNITLTDSNKIQSPICHAIKNASSSSDIDCVPQTLSDVEGVTVKYSPIKLNDIASDTSRNFSDSESDFSRTGDRFFISTGILGTHELTKTATSLNGGFIDTESNLNENCYSDSDDGCKIEETGMDACSPIDQDELEESDRTLMEDRQVKALSECEGNDMEVTEITGSDSVNLYDVSDGEVADDSNQAGSVEKDVGIGESEEVPLDDKVESSSYSISNTSVHDLDEMEKGVQNLENIESIQNKEELMSFNSFSLDENKDAITSNLNEESQLMCKIKNSRVSKRGRGRRRRGSSFGRGKNRSRCVSKKNIKSNLFCNSGNEVCDDNLTGMKNVTGDKTIDGSLLGSSLPENEPRSGFSVVNDLNKEAEYTSGKDDTDSNVRKGEEEPEPELFEHVSHSGRKLKLRSHLVKAVSKGNLRKQVNTTTQPKPDEPLVPKTTKNKRGRGGRTNKKTEFTEGKKIYDDKVICEKDSELMNEDCKSNSSSVAKVNIKCGKCDYVTNSMAKFNSHAHHEHNGLARPFGENQEFSEEEWHIIISSTMKSVKKLKCEICAKIFRSLGGYKYHVKFCGHSVEEIQTTCSLCLKLVRQHNLQVHMRKFHGQMIRKKGEEPAPAPVELDPEEPRPRRKAATSCDAKLKVWRSLNPAELNGSDQSEDGDSVCERIGIDKFYEREKRTLPKEIQIKLEEHIKLNGKANCPNSNCSYNFKNVKNGRRHYAKCPFSSIPKKYKCKQCGDTCESEDQFKVHISVKHKELVEIDLESDYELSDDERRSVNPRLRSRPRVPGKPSIDQMRPFEPASKWTLEFMMENYSEELFADLTVSTDDWVLLDKEELKNYIPTVDVSPKFKVSVVSKIADENKCTDWQVLDRFSGASIYEGYVLFTGGPTSASAWCPLPLKDTFKEMSQYLALSATSFPDKRYSLVQSYSHEGVIQIWQCPFNMENESSVPQFQLGIAHNYGSIWALAWCPSGIYNLSQSDKLDSESDLQKIGLLAAACSDGTVRVFVVPNPAQLGFHGPLKIFKVRPKLTLRPSSLTNGNAQCLKVDWFRGKGHRYIAGAYSTGYVCIWDVCTSSPLLRSTDHEGDVLYPINTFLAHNGVCSTVSFCPTTYGRNLLSGGNDRTYKFWDLENTNMPLSIIRKGLVTDSYWISHWGGCFISFDDVYGLSNTNTCFKENGFYGIHSRNVLSSNSPVWTISGSEWMNTLIQGDSAGEVVITIQQQLFKNYENEKVPSKRKVPLLAVKMENLLSEKTRVKFPKKNKKGSLSSQSEEDGLSSTVHLDLPRTYSETCDGFGVVFAEKDYRNFSNIPEDQLMECKRSERMEPGPLGCYPLMSATSVSWNNNFTTNSWVFIGTQSGLCRLVSIQAMKNGTTNLAESLREMIKDLNSGEVDS
ncbi:uncharacterized protein [Palaemon carinicauda]|uniref:uncharacterized protein n=1 Tax=Palaemon carinicauda TaxID=392227 RepID=UPI0035B5BD2F